jgi:thioredoxin-dependent peroxiredoxin
MARVDVGDEAPAFELPGTGGRTYRLSDYRDRGVLLAFYPGDFTRVCTAQFCSYRDNAERLDQLGVPVLGISPQSIDSHERWASEKELNVPLLADEDLAVAKAYGSVGWGSPLVRLAGMPATPGGSYVKRSIFVIDGEGIVRYRHMSLTGASYQSVDDLEAAVETLRA